MSQTPDIKEIGNLNRINSIIQSKIKVYGTSNPENDDIIKGVLNGNKDKCSCVQGDNNLVLDLLDSYFIVGIMLTFYHYDNSRYYIYDCYISDDNLKWTPIVEGKQAKANETILINNCARYIKFKGKNSNDSYLHFMNFKII